MVTDEYFEIVSKSLAPLETLLPPGSKLLFESIVDDLVLLESMANNVDDNLDPLLRELSIMEALTKSAKGESSGLYNECFILVKLSDEDSSVFEPLKRELILPSPELDDINPSKRLSELENWLMASDEGEEEFFCDSFVEDVRSDGARVYLPNRVPERYQAGEISFISIF